MPLKIVRSHSRAILPRKATEKSAGYDLYSVENKIVKAKSTALISTGLRMEIPPPFFGKIEGRSGLAYRYNIHVGGGVIDRDYRGEIQVILVNNATIDFHGENYCRIHVLTLIKVLSGMAIAQIIFQPCYNQSFVETTELSQTERNDRGFGSSGI
ncbi:DUTPase-like protein [Leptotrombidium deliense]|uniref:Deoxyuridine 5'-triphosphate nucleotidohydrolase n=1 Tax=Leptotrombidium deliense TaxID=299467 RepID=A0A443SI67_9ACAR|nr:DUTPase-like protein [Leptotrombidium deliense]